MSYSEKYELVVGLEIHAQLSTKSKIFSPDANRFGDGPNQNISVITLAHPGTLPKLNKKAVEYAVRMGLASNSEISSEFYFDRKSYFYPDLPKGYQITQDNAPICRGGHFDVNIEGKKSKVRLNRIHLEDDAGKSMHKEGQDYSVVDLNRAGTPLIEIVTEPDLRSSDEAFQLLTNVRQLVRYLDICDGNMEQGSLRCDANVSLRPIGSTVYGNKVEIKNMNSIRNVKHAIENEAKRQAQLIDQGIEILSETRSFEVNTGGSFPLREKEKLNDYRYFPDPDLPPFEVSREWLNEIKSRMPELPHQVRSRFQSAYRLSVYEAEILTSSKEMAQFFDAWCRHISNHKLAANLTLGPIKSFLNKEGILINDFPVSTKALIELVGMEKIIGAGRVSKVLLPELIKRPGVGVVQLAKELGLDQESDVVDLEGIVKNVLESMPEKVDSYKKGKKNLIQLFMGEVMKRTKGQADPKKTIELINALVG